jgi:hypothetical protein
MCRFIKQQLFAVNCSLFPRGFLFFSEQRTMNTELLPPAFLDFVQSRFARFIKRASENNFSVERKLQSVFSTDKLECKYKCDWRGLPPFFRRAASSCGGLL